MDELEKLQLVGLLILKQLHQSHKKPHLSSLPLDNRVLEWPIPNPTRRTGSLDQLSPDKGILKDLHGEPVGLSKVQDGSGVQKGDKMSHQLWSLPKTGLCHAGHLLLLYFGNCEASGAFENWRAAARQVVLAES